MPLLRCHCSGSMHKREIYQQTIFSRGYLNAGDCGFFLGGGDKKGAPFAGSPVEIAV